MSGVLKADLAELFSKNNIEYFLTPKESGWDFFNTTVYSVILVAAAYAIYRILKRIKVKIDERLAIAISPYIIFGGFVRVIKDAGALQSYIFQTPGIYVFVSSVFFAVFLVSMLLQKKFKIEYYKTAFVIGVFLLPSLILQLTYPRLYAVTFVAALLFPWFLLFKFIRWHTSNKIVTILHMFDATATYVSMSFFGYLEQHIVPTIFINTFGPISFVFLKIIVIVGVLYTIDKFFGDDREFCLYIKLIIGILGAATGTRDVITLAAGI